jgi:hypothetical protein
MTQSYNKAKQQTAKLGGLQWIIVVFLIMVLPFFTIFLAKYTLDVAKMPIDATTDAKIKEVRDRHLLWLMSLFIAYSFFLSFYYMTSDYFPKLIFIPANVAFALAIAGVSLDAVRKINEGGKNAEYKKYVDVLAAVSFFSLGIVFVSFVSVVLSFMSRPKQPIAIKKPVMA